MKQRKLLTEVYRACISHDEQKLSKLRRQEFEKIFKRKSMGKTFSTKWTVVRV